MSLFIKMSWQERATVIYTAVLLLCNYPIDVVLLCCYVSVARNKLRIRRILKAKEVHIVIIIIIVHHIIYHTTWYIVDKQLASYQCKNLFVKVEKMYQVITIVRNCPKALDKKGMRVCQNKRRKKKFRNFFIPTTYNYNVLWPISYNKF